MAVVLSWCTVHNDRGNPNFNNHSCWTGTRGEIEAAPCEITTMRLVPNDALVVEKVDGEWPVQVLGAMVGTYYGVTERGGLLTELFKAQLDALAIEGAG